MKKKVKIMNNKISYEELFENQDLLQMTNRFTVPHNVLEDDNFLKMKISSKFLYIIFAKLSNRMGCDKGKNKGWFFCSLKNLEKMTGMQRKTIQRSIKELEVSQYLEIERGYNPHNGFRSANFYRINGFRYQIAKNIVEINS